MKKQWICTALLASLLLSLAGCNINPPSAENPDDEVISEITTVTEETSAPETTETPATTTEGATPTEETTSPAEETVAPETTVTEATTTPAPITTTEAPAPITKDYSAILKDCVTSEMLEYCPPFTKADIESESTGDFILQMLGITAEQTEDFAISASAMNIQAYCTAIIKPVKGQEDAVLAAMNTYIENQQNAFEFYLPGPYEIACAAKAEKLSDGTVIIVMCEDSDTVLKNLKTALK